MMDERKHLYPTVSAELSQVHQPATTLMMLIFNFQISTFLTLQSKWPVFNLML